MSVKRKGMAQSKPSFVSHVSRDGVPKETARSCFYIPLDDSAEMRINVDLLPGEILVNQIGKVMQYVAYGNESSGHIGTLFLTNYKVSFVTLLADKSPQSDKFVCRRNKLIGADEVALTNISDIYQVTKGRKKKLTKSGNLTMAPISCLELHCKDFRIHGFSFDICDRAEVCKLVTAIVHYAFPSRSDLLFAFYYEGSRHSHDVESKNIVDFSFPEHWEEELKRLQVDQNFRVTHCNAHFSLSPNLPECFVVPSLLSDAGIREQQEETKKRCVPLWSYSYANGCALVRLAYGSSSEVMDKMVQVVKDSHPMKRKPETIDLGLGSLPSLRDLQLSFDRLRDQCMPSTSKDLWSSDLTWYSALEGCQWLNYVRLAISVAYSVVEKLSFDNRSVVIKEKDGATDFSPLISCLAQLMMDPFRRTISGFESLIEKEWVALGHKFSDRCGIVWRSDAEQSPLFLLFLDCVWQMLQQFPSSFEFSEIYLTSLWDSVGLALFRNFIFNGPCHRSNVMANLQRQSSRKNLNGFSNHNDVMSVWNWEQQFTADDILLFTNPLYVAAVHIREQREIDYSFEIAYQKFMKHEHGTKSNSMPKQTIDIRKIFRVQSSDVMAIVGNDVLRMGFKAPQIKLWEHCYLRWLTPIQIVGGGMPSEFVAQSVLMGEIRELQEKLSKCELLSPMSRKKPAAMKLSRFSTFSTKLSECISSSYPFSPTRPANLPTFSIVSPSAELDFLNGDASIDDFVNVNSELS